MHWKDSKELHRIIHSLSGALRAVLLELTDGPMSRHEIRDFLNRMGRGRHSRGIGTDQLNLEQDLRKALEVKVLEERHGRYLLTPGFIPILKVKIYWNWTLLCPGTYAGPWTWPAAGLAGNRERPNC